MNLVIYSVSFSFILFVICYLFGQIFKNFFSISEIIPSSLIGLSLFFTFVQLFVYIENFLKLKTSISSLISIILFFLMLLIILKYRKYLYLSKVNFFVLLFSSLVTVLCLYRSSFYSLGSTSDSVFYMSMVSENAFNEYWTGMEYYTGRVIENFLPLYDFQGFYHFFAHVTKIGARFIDAVSFSPIYIWSALSLFLFSLFESIFTIFTYVNIKNKGVSCIYAILAFVWSCTSWNYLYGYLGNSWRVLFLTLQLASIYFYCKNKKSIYLLLVSSASCSMIACSSSGLFISLFSTVALIAYSFLFDNNIKKNLYVFLTSLFSFIYLCVLVYSTNGTKVLLIIAAYFIFIGLYFALLHLKSNIRFMIVIVTVIILLICAIFIPSTFSFFDFFNRNINEMTVNYFVFDSPGTISVNFVWIGACIYLMVKNWKLVIINEYFKYLSLVIILFLNPITGKFLMEYVTDTVLYRAYEIFFNSFNLIFVAFAIHGFVLGFKSKFLKFGITLCIIFLLLIGIVENFNDSPYNSDLVKEIDPVYRIPSDELELDLNLAELANSSYSRLRVVSQFPFTKGIVRNIYLAFGIDTTRTFCTTCNILEGPVEEPTPIFNLFLLRDYADQMIYSIPADFESACDPLFEHRFKYLLLDKNQTRLDNGVYVPIYYSMRACYNVIYENDFGVIMDSRYVD